MDRVTIGISDMAAVRAGQSIITYALGSCVGVALYDPLSRIAGLAHIMLPSGGNNLPGPGRRKFVDTALPELVNQMREMGALTYLLKAKIAGGADMFKLNAAGPISNIGERNVKMARYVLRAIGIAVVAEDVGGSAGRTVELFADDGVFRIKTISAGTRDI